MILKVSFCPLICLSIGDYKSKHRVGSEAEIYQCSIGQIGKLLEGFRASFRCQGGSGRQFVGLRVHGRKLAFCFEKSRAAFPDEVNILFNRSHIFVKLDL